MPRTSLKTETKLRERFDELHKDGSRRWRWLWIKANEKAISVGREHGLDPTRLKNKVLLSAMATAMCEYFDRGTASAVEG
jgi:hypothetical protein